MYIYLYKKHGTNVDIYTCVDIEGRISCPHETIMYPRYTLWLDIHSNTLVHLRWYNAQAQILFP